MEQQLKCLIKLKHNKTAWKCTRSYKKGTKNKTKQMFHNVLTKQRIIQTEDLSKKLEQ